MVTTMPTGRGPLTHVHAPVQQLLKPAVSTKTAEAEPKAELAAGSVELSPLYGVAMLKIAMELKKADARPLDELMSGVLKKMRLDENEFRAFLELNGGMLRTIAQRRGY